MNVENQPVKQLGLMGATGVGIGAIVGGGILVLAGTALAVSGPAAIVAFALNGVIALLTALSFAEMASKFPESGGTYTFAKKVFSIETAFLIGWVIWFASIAAAALYALGFAHFLLVSVEQLAARFGAPMPTWMAADATETGIAMLCTALIVSILCWKAAGSGNWINIIKVAVFAVLIVGGFWAMAGQDIGQVRTQLHPFFTGGLVGVIQAMGFTFIALQGFDLIAAVSGEVREPTKNVPRAMLLSLFVALLVYIPLLLVVATVGSSATEPIADLARRDPEAVIARAAERYLGAFGYWLVLAAALLATFSALQANLFAASRIARAMAHDRTLPSFLRWIGARRQTPYAAIAVTGLITTLLLALLHDVSAAGAASSLIFLLSFALAHWTAVLVRQRAVDRPPPFRTPWFPLVPVVGGTACLGLAVFQSWAVPTAGLAASIWLAIGGVLFLTLFAHRARVHDAAATARDPELVRLRGRVQQVLVPVANPRNVAALIELAHTLTPARIGRLIVMSVVVIPDQWSPDDDDTPFATADAVVRAAIAASMHRSIELEALLVPAAEPVAEIARVARRTSSDLLVVGLSHITQDSTGTRSEQLLSATPADVVALRAARDWSVDHAGRILVLVAGHGGHDSLRGRILGNLARTGRREVTYLRFVPDGASPVTIRNARREVSRLAADEMPDAANVVIAPAADAVAAAAEQAAQFDLVVLGVARIGKSRLFGGFTRQLALLTDRPMLVISHG